MLQRQKAEGDPAQEFSPCIQQGLGLFLMCMDKSAPIIGAAFRNRRLSVTHPDLRTLLKKYPDSAELAVCTEFINF